MDVHAKNEADILDDCSKHPKRHRDTSTGLPGLPQSGTIRPDEPVEVCGVRVHGSVLGQDSTKSRLLALAVPRLTERARRLSLTWKEVCGQTNRPVADQLNEYPFVLPQTAHLTHADYNVLGIVSL